MSPTYKSCQSCGMPLKRDEKGGGTEADGTKSAIYCSHCYSDGRFVMPDITMEEMKERVIGKLAEFGLPKFLAGFFTRNTSKLERWKNG